MNWFKKIFGKLFSRIVIVIVMILLQLCALLLVLQRFSEYFSWFYFLCLAISVTVVLLVINRDMNPGFKLAMTVPILLFPLFGGVLYLTLYAGYFKRGVIGRLGKIDQREKALFRMVDSGTGAFSELPQTAASQFRFLHKIGGYPLYQNTETCYYPLGDDMFPVMKQELSRATSFIYLEYFIIAPGKMWDEILSILTEKASQGIDVRMIYDDIGTIRRLPSHYAKKLQAVGIRSMVYNPLVPMTAAWQNKRDHRKILSIDGKVAFTGGINLSDEYINIDSRLGHWKDGGIMLRGDAANTLTLMFRSLWGILVNDGSEKEITPAMIAAQTVRQAKDGFVMPYGDSPYDYVQTGRDTYLNAINAARDSICITTPYFVVDSETLTALKLAAAKGVRIRIITPHIADKWYVHLITRSYYAELLACGIEVYEYTPGFIHAKTMTADGEIGICGSVNFDYRSFYLQLECGVLLYRSVAVQQMCDDFEKTLLVCGAVTPENLKKQNWVARLLTSVLRLFAPMM